MLLWMKELILQQSLGCGGIIFGLCLVDESFDIPRTYGIPYAVGSMWVLVSKHV